MSDEEFPRLPGERKGLPAYAVHALDPLLRHVNNKLELERNGILPQSEAYRDDPGYCELLVTQLRQEK